MQAQRADYKPSPAAMTEVSRYLFRVRRGCPSHVFESLLMMLMRYHEGRADAKFIVSRSKLVLGKFPNLLSQLCPLLPTIASVSPHRCLLDAGAVQTESGTWRLPQTTARQLGMHLSPSPTAESVDATTPKPSSATTRPPKPAAAAKPPGAATQLPKPPSGAPRPTSATSAPKPPTGATSAPKPPTGATSVPKPPTGATSAPKPPTGATSAPRPPGAATSAPKSADVAPPVQRPSSSLAHTRYGPAGAVLYARSGAAAVDSTLPAPPSSSALANSATTTKPATAVANKATPATPNSSDCDAVGTPTAVPNGAAPVPSRQRTAGDKRRQETNDDDSPQSRRPARSTPVAAASPPAPYSPLSSPVAFPLSASGFASPTADVPLALSPDGYDSRRERARYVRRRDSNDRQPALAPTLVPLGVPSAVLAGKQHSPSAAAAYVEQVRSAFGRRSPIYKEFIETLAQYHRSQDLAAAIRSLSALFVSQPALLEGLERFLPADSQQALDLPPLQCEMEQPGLSPASLYVERVRQRFGADSDVYCHFIALLKKYHKRVDDDHGAAARILKRVGRLFRGHADLVHDFKQFLPTVLE